MGARDQLSSPQSPLSGRSLKQLMQHEEKGKQLFACACGFRVGPELITWSLATFSMLDGLEGWRPNEQRGGAVELAVGTGQGLVGL